MFQKAGVAVASLRTIPLPHLDMVATALRMNSSVRCVFFPAPASALSVVCDGMLVQGAPAPGNERFGASPVGMANDHKGRKGMYPSYGAINQLQTIAGVHKLIQFHKCSKRQ